MNCWDVCFFCLFFFPLFFSWRDFLSVCILKLGAGRKEKLIFPLKTFAFWHFSRPLEPNNVWFHEWHCLDVCKHAHMWVQCFLAKSPMVLIVKTRNEKLNSTPLMLWILQNSHWRYYPSYSYFLPIREINDTERELNTCLVLTNYVAQILLSKNYLK